MAINILDENDKREILDYVDDKFSELGGNQEPVEIFSDLDFVIGYLSSAGLHTDLTTYKTTSTFIPVAKGETIVFSGNTFRLIVIYNSDQTYKESSGKNVSTFNYTATEDSYVRFTVSVDLTGHSVILHPATTATCDYKNMLTGKKWYACGDSFTADGYGTTDQPKFTEGLYTGKNMVYPFFIGNRCGMDVHNIAAGGKTLAYIEGYNNCFSDTQYITIPADADYITLYFGINDDHQNVQIGTADDTSNTTFCGAWNVVLEHLITNHPLAHIGIIVSNGTTSEFAEATKQMAVKWGIPYLDLATDEQIPLLIRTLKSDVCDTAKNVRNNNFYVSLTEGSENFHPNADCHEYESRFIESWLMRI